MKRRKTNRGTALVVVLVLISILTIVMSVFMSSLHTLRKSQKVASRRAECALVARSGLERAIWELGRDASFQSASGSIGQGRFEITAQAVLNSLNERDISSTGTLTEDSDRPLTRTLKIRVRLGPPVEIVQWIE